MCLDAESLQVKIQWEISVLSHYEECSMNILSVGLGPKVPLYTPHLTMHGCRSL